MHVSLYVGNGEFFDLSSRRAKIFLAETMFFHYPDPFIFRASLSEEQKEKIVSMARSFAKNKVRHSNEVRKLIGKQRAFGIRVKNPARQGYVCSNSIAEFFSKEGVDLVPGVHPLRVSPMTSLKAKN